MANRAHKFLDASGNETNDPLAIFRFGDLKITGDVLKPVVPYEDWTFDENNIFPEEYAKRLRASGKQY